MESFYVTCDDGVDDNEVYDDEGESENENANCSPCSSASDDENANENESEDDSAERLLQIFRRAAGRG